MSVDWQSVGVTALFSAAAVVIGGWITWYVTKRYYEQAAKDLESKVLRLEQLITLVAQYLECEGLIKDLEYSDGGTLKGFTQTMKGGAIPSDESFGGGALTQEDDTSDKQP